MKENLMIPELLNLEVFVCFLFAYLLTMISHMEKEEEETIRVEKNKICQMMMMKKQNIKTKQNKKIHFLFLDQFFV